MHNTEKFHQDRSVRYGDYSIFQDGGRSPCWVMKRAIFIKVWYGRECPYDAAKVEAEISEMSNVRLGRNFLLSPAENCYTISGKFGRMWLICKILFSGPPKSFLRRNDTCDVLRVNSGEAVLAVFSGFVRARNSNRVHSG